MNSKIFYLIISVCFGIISIPSLLSILFETRILLDYINEGQIKLIMVFYVSFYLSKTIKKKWLNTLGQLFTLGLLIGVFFKIMHWPPTLEIMCFFGSGLVIILITSWILIKKRTLINLLLIAFIAIWLITILSSKIELLWWMNLIIAFLISIFGSIRAIKTKL